MQARPDLALPVLQIACSGCFRLFSGLFLFAKQIKQMLHLPSKLPYPISFCNTKNTNVDFVIRNHILELVLLTPPVLPSANSRQRILTASVCNLYPQIFTAWTYPKPAGAA